MKKKQLRHFYIAHCKKYKREVEPIYEYAAQTQLNGHIRLVFIKNPYLCRRYGIMDARTGYFVISNLSKMTQSSFNSLCMLFACYLPIREQSKYIKRVSKLPKWEEQEE